MKNWPLVSFVMTLGRQPAAKAKLFFFPSNELEIIEDKAVAANCIVPQYGNIFGEGSFFLFVKLS